MVCSLLRCRCWECRIHPWCQASPSGSRAEIRAKRKEGSACQSHCSLVVLLRENRVFAVDHRVRSGPLFGEMDHCFGLKRPEVQATARLSISPPEGEWE